MGGRGQRRAHIQHPADCPLFLLLLADPILSSHRSPTGDAHKTSTASPPKQDSPTSQARPPPPTPPSNGTSGHSQRAHTRRSISIQIHTGGNTSQSRKIVGKGHQFNIDGHPWPKTWFAQHIAKWRPRFKESRAGFAPSIPCAIIKFRWRARACLYSSFIFSSSETSQLWQQPFDRP